MKKIYAIVNRDGQQVWPFRYGGKRGWEDAEEIARELRRTQPDVDVEEVIKEKKGEDREEFESEYEFEERWR